MLPVTLVRTVVTFPVAANTAAKIVVVSEIDDVVIPVDQSKLMAGFATWISMRLKLIALVFVTFARNKLKVSPIAEVVIEDVVVWVVANLVVVSDIDEVVIFVCVNKVMVGIVVITEIDDVVTLPKAEIPIANNESMTDIFKIVKLALVVFVGLNSVALLAIAGAVIPVLQRIDVA